MDNSQECFYHLPVSRGWHSAFIRGGADVEPNGPQRLDMGKAPQQLLIIVGVSSLCGKRDQAVGYHWIDIFLLRTFGLVSHIRYMLPSRPLIAQW